MTNGMETLWQRLAVIISLLEGSPQGTLGRTAIVKLLYLLQEVKRVPLGYDFRLYTYGPFDSEVLSDLETAQSFQALHVRTVLFPSGYGYDVRAGAKAEAVKECASDWLASHESKLTWAVKNFAGRSASELELIATIVYVAREFTEQARPYALHDLAKRVCDMKPRFSEEDVAKKCAELHDMDILHPAA